jgi:hypothetical protein
MDGINMSAALALGAVIYLAGLAIGLYLIYHVIRAAVLGALREHYEETHQ